MLKRNNKGSTLILVVVAISFISLLGSLILSITMTNIQIKQIDYSAKDNFYDSEGVIDELKANLAIKSSEALNNSYQYVMSNYTEFNRLGVLKEEYEKYYINEMLDLIGEDGKDFVVGTSDYNFLGIKLKNLFITPQYKNYIVNSDTITGNDLIVRFDPTRKDNALIIKDLFVRYIDPNTKYETTIRTDINMRIPTVDFESVNLSLPFMEYSLVANKGLKVVNDGVRAKILGNLYTGASTDANYNYGGIYVANKATLNVQTNSSELVVVSRMDIAVDNGSKLYIGQDDQPSSIWTRNFTTVRADKTDEAVLVAKGDLYVEDDTVLNADNSNVAFDGRYTGFSYNRLNKALSSLTADESNPITSGILNSKYSSAMYINGKNSMLNLSQMQLVYLAGKAFISRGHENIGPGASYNDIPIGESITVKSNQIIYLIPPEYLKAKVNPVVSDKDNGLDRTKIPDEIWDKLDLSKPYNAYYYKNTSGVKMIYYYYNFRNQEALNDYFNMYYADEKNKDKIDNIMDTYLKDVDKPLDISGGYTGIGYALKYSTADGSSIYASPKVMSDRMLSSYTTTAKQYRALQDTLLPLEPGINNTNYRYAGDDKTLNPLFNNIISHNGGTCSITKESQDTNYTDYGFIKTGDGDSDFRYKYQEYTLSDGSQSYILIIDNAKVLNFEQIGAKVPYFADLANRKGILVTTGDLNISGNWNGCIIARGNVIIDSTALEYTLTSNSQLVQDTMNSALSKESGLIGNAEELKKNKMSHYFDAFSTEVDGGSVDLGDINVENYIGFDNWEKNVE